MQSNLGLTLRSSPYEMHDLEPVTSPMDSISASGKSQQTPSSFERGELVRKLALPVGEQFVGARTVSSGPLHNRLYYLWREKGAEPDGGPSSFRER